MNILLRTSALLGLLVLSACVSTRPPVQPDSLADFRDTLVRLDTRAAEALTVEHEWSYRNYKESVKSRADLNPNSLTLDFCTSEFDARWGGCDPATEGTPVFIVIADSRRDLGLLNQTMIDYANFLLVFNNANEGTRSSLESAAVRIGESARSTAARFGRSFDEARFGAFAKIGVGIVEQLLARKQREGMAAVLADYQPAVQAFAELGSGAMNVSAVGIQTEYQNDAQPLKVAIVRETDGARRLKLVEELIALNEQTARQLDVLESLASAYDSAPGAHAELISALQSGSRASLHELVAQVEAIGTAYRTLHPADGD